MFSKGISSAVLPRKEPYDRGFWHLTLCTLLSSQGSDAPSRRPLSHCTGTFPVMLLSFSVSVRLTEVKPIKTSSNTRSEYLHIVSLGWSRLRPGSIPLSAPVGYVDIHYGGLKRPSKLRASRACLAG